MIWPGTKVNVGGTAGPSSMSLITGLRIESGEGAALRRASAKSRSGNLRMARNRRRRLSYCTTSSLLLRPLLLLLLRLGFVQQTVEFAFLIFVQDLVDAGLAGGQHVQIIAGEISEGSSKLLGLLRGEVEFFLQPVNGDVFAGLGPESRAVQALMHAHFHGQGAGRHAHKEHQPHGYEERSPGVLH